MNLCNFLKAGILLLTLNLGVVGADPLYDQKILNAGDCRTWSSINRSEAFGMKFSFDYPTTWGEAETPYSNLLVTLASNHGTGSDRIALQVLKVPEEKAKTFLTFKQKENLISFEIVKMLLPPNAVVDSYQKTKLDGEFCALVEYTEMLERSGVKIQQKSLFYMVPHTETWLIINASVGAEQRDGMAALTQRFNATKPLYLEVFKTLKLQNIFEKTDY